MSSSQVYYVTGASKGFGALLVEKILANGDKVAATSRDKKQLNDLFGPNSDKFLALSVELANEESVKKSIEETIKHFGTLDVIINNAGYGPMGIAEEISDKIARDNFDINFFGAWNVIRHTVPILRQKRSGVVINISSIGGTVGFKGFSSYCATKFALDGLSESLAAEVKPFNVKVTTINPGYFKTEFLSDSKEVEVTIPDYKDIYDFIAHHSKINGNQRGDPKKLVDLIIKVANHKGDLPLHIHVGPDSYAIAEQKANSLLKDLKEWKELATNTDRADYVQQ